MSRLVVSIGHVEFTGSSHVLYVIQVQQDAETWHVRRTYADFRKLRDDVQRVMKDTRTHALDDDASRAFLQQVTNVPFPSKRLFNSRTDHVVKARAVELHGFLIRLLCLTHSYRKAQKARDKDTENQKTQASVTIFHLLRDFLKPVTIATDGAAHSGDLLGSGGDDANALAASDESDPTLATRLIRESKILAMKTFNWGNNERTPTHAESDVETHLWHEIETDARPPSTAKHEESETEKDKRGAETSLSSASSSSSSSSSAASSSTLSRRSRHGRQASPNKKKTTNAYGSKENQRSLTTSVSRSKRKARSKTTTSLHMSDSERMFHVNSALNAQAISIKAQRGLETYLSEYSAIMVLRYVDRFVNKAVTKAPGCYRVNAENRLVIDSQRFLEELETTFPDLPANFGELFHIGTPGSEDEWGFPPALDTYVQLKWDAFQATSSHSLTYEYGHSSSAADQTSDSDDSDTEYEYEEVGGGGGYMTSKQPFSNDEESMLQEMIANGTAGREQMLRLRRQTNEHVWHRRGTPGARSQRVIEEASSSDPEEGQQGRTKAREKRRSKREARRSASNDVEKYQQEQNARRKDRLSRVQSGGFV
ncbi:hypothetical protein PsorP6_005623 [Peronosclerospora sorghi]|uniref:Uncharacterized protein n=1 Tax=Peronosclerospora sorghi TaxID=230839 RepID=A0ACC0W3S7_9STRA|nr:hypothetical protein PsorP6_005623 [Peronosclerospora sorghi]